MSRGSKQRIAAVVALAVLGTGALVALRRGPGGPSAGKDGLKIPRFAVTEPAPEAEPPRPETPEEVAKHVQETVTLWRNAVLEKNADVVVRLDGEFLGRPERYLEALAKSASADSDERVRAFSTRVLGKVHRPALAPTFGRLLEDKSPFVRQNAAWALGELSSEADGRAAARQTLAELRHVRSRDPAGDVRSAAKGALEKLE
jgi:HEAT repeat protein